MMKIRAVQPRLLVADIQTSIGFYRDQLDFTVNFATDEFADLSNGGTLTLMTEAAFRPLLGGPPNPVSSRAGRWVDSLLVITVDDVASVFERLHQAGVTVVAPPRPAPGGGPIVAYIEDPDRHVIEINDSMHV